MPSIPYTSQISALSTVNNSPLQNNKATAADFGAGIGGALQELGVAGDSAAKVVYKDAQAEQKERVAAKVATDNYTERFYKLRNSAPADGTGFVDMVREDYTSWVDSQADAIEDDNERMTYKSKQMASLDGYITNAATVQYQSGLTMSKDRANEALVTLQNKINTDPTMFDDFRKQGNELIDSFPGMDEGTREATRRNWMYDSSKRRFDGMMNTAKTVQDVDNIANDLTGINGRDWTKELSDTDFTNLGNQLGTMRRNIAAQYKTGATAAVSSLEDRQKSDPFAMLPSQEIENATSLTRNADSPELQGRIARAVRNQDIARTEGRLPPTEMQARINAAKGSPSLAYPNTPPRVSSAINKASEVTGVSASYLGTVAWREYGTYFKEANVDLGKEFAPFKPKALGQGVDLRNVEAQTVDALTVAGKALGAPLQLVTNKEGQLGKGSVYVSTVGLEREDKSKIVAALVDAGFTNFDETNTSIGVLASPKVAGSFGQRDSWGGWSDLSPEVVEVLKERGFKGGASAADIKRNDIAPKRPEVNYAGPTRILDENGQPTSSAVGVFQFTKDTWLNMIKDPTVSAAMGIPPGQSDEALLAMRGDPEKSTIAAGFLAKQNKATLEASLDRPVNDAELYMAHFLGSPKAVALLANVRDNPNLVAADLFPAEAKANKPVFYQNGKPLTVAQVYDRISDGFNLAPDRVKFEDNEYRQRMMEVADKRLKEDPMQFVLETGAFTLTPITDEGGFTSRGREAMAVADYYHVPQKEIKPFTKAEAEFLSKTIKDGNINDTVALMSSIQSMGYEPAQAALRQLEETDTVFAHAAGLYMEGSTNTALDVARGRKRIKENPAIMEQLGATKDQINAQFIKESGAALFGIAPEDRQTVQDATTALYIEKLAAAGKNMGSFNSELYKSALNEALGGPNSLDDVYGNTTYLPRGIDGRLMENALRNMTTEDIANMNMSGQPPQYADGTVADIREIYDDILFQRVSGSNEYRVLTEDGRPLFSADRDANGNQMVYRVALDRAKLDKISSRPRRVASSNGGNAKGRMGPRS